LIGKDPQQWAQFGFKRELEIAKTYCAVEIAVIDLAARLEGCALSELIGGRKRDRIKLYGSAGMYQSPQGYAEEAAAGRRRVEAQRPRSGAQARAAR